MKTPTKSRLEVFFILFGFLVALVILSVVSTMITENIEKRLSYQLHDEYKAK